MTKAETSGLQSMTGYGASEGEAGSIKWRWELRTVNGRGLDAKFRLPPGAEALEPDIRSALRVLHRGTVNISLKLDRAEAASALVIDEEALAAAAKAIGRVQEVITCDPPRPEAVLQMRGVLTTPATDNGLTPKELASLKGGFEEALAALLASRRAEGDRVRKLLEERCAEMARNIAAIREKTATTREQIAERLKAQLGELLADQVAPERLAQEAAMLAIRADVTEELDRLDVHTASFRELLKSDGAAGRRLEFLTQELMREASTLTAKLHTAHLKNDGLDMKELIDGLREQVLNIA
ncbi:YicC/YloC family endoribonuclease [Parvularcula lutaonensis]|uniref:YicC/YloC family endoribonuclease n=1 Tax=Parvularcula lutaonensis TaxID=491923 RepID=A0ABV7M9M5_9PROT|nr:YicC/YloC family endoribonuclease [Parvularcula lutaonensis]GGY42585.1 hypothetical protein GCM10007148_09050 [Parvularcula lutaonensis]